MHVLITVNAAWNVLNFRRPIIRSLLDSGHRVTVLAPVDDSVPALEAMGCRFLPLEMNVKGLNPLQDLQLIRRFRTCFARENPDAILSFTIKNNLFGAMAAKSLKIPFLPNITGLGTAFLSSRALQFVSETLYRRAFSGLKTVFFQNGDDRGLFLDRGLVQAEQAKLLPGSGIDLTEFQPTEMPLGEAPVFLMIARLLRDKGVMEYVEAARIVRKAHPDARFQILGAVDSANRSAISQDMVRRWQAEGVIEHLGALPDVRPVIAQAHCIVLPSYREGAPRTLIEAAAMARPLIATDVPGCRDVVDDRVSGLLCDVRSADSLAKACLNFLELSPENRANMGQAGRKKMEIEFDDKIVIAAYRQALGDMLGQGVLKPDALGTKSV